MPYNVQRPPTKTEQPHYLHRSMSHAHHPGTELPHMFAVKAFILYHVDEGSISERKEALCTRLYRYQLTVYLPTTISSYQDNKLKQANENEHSRVSSPEHHHSFRHNPALPKIGGCQALGSSWSTTKYMINEIRF